MPPLPNLAVQSVQEVLFANCSEAGSHDTLYHGTLSEGRRASPPLVRGASPPLMDLPSSSQLEPSVLNELPLSIQEEIRQSMQKKAVCQKALFPQQPLTERRGTQVSSLEEHRQFDVGSVVIDDEVQFLSDLRGYLNDWVGHFCGGPKDGDVQVVADYLAVLLKENLELVVVILKYLQRLVAKARVQDWCSAFNVILSRIQTRVLLHFGGRVPLEPI